MSRFYCSTRMAMLLALAFAVPNAEAMLPRGVSGDRAADRIFGKPGFSEINPYTTVAGKLWLPHGVVVDRTNATANKLYIYDAGNNRILGFDLNTCRSSLTDPLGCTAAIVLGQPSMNSSACNGDSAFQNYPLRAPASASSLCGLPENSLSISESGSGASMAVDAAGNLYVTDFWNHRVLKYNDPFNTDGVADDVWGQANFSNNSCNKGMSSPDATSLCFGWGDSNNWTAGVDVDANGTLWVVDSGNNRVLRFSPGSKTADLVLGQSNFTSRGPGTALNQLWDPSAVRVIRPTPTTERVYVSDTNNNRVMAYNSPFNNGKAGSLFGSGFSAPQGIDFDPTAADKVWITNRTVGTIEPWSESTGVKIPGQDLGYIDQGSGSVGIDSAGNVYVAIGAGEHDNDVIVFDKGSDPLHPTKRLFGSGGNLPTASGIGGSVEAVVVSDGQLIVAERGRLLFWNNPASAVNGRPADGYANGATSFADLDPTCCGVSVADKNHHLWTTRYQNGDDQVRVDVYQLPLTVGAVPFKTLLYPFCVLGGGQLTSSQIFDPFTGIAISDAGELWLSHARTNRVFRVRNPLSSAPPSPCGANSPLVDVVLGQASVGGTLCNQGHGTEGNRQPGPDRLCLPGHVALDRLGNLFVSDHSLEIQGNLRLLEFAKNLIPSGNASVIYAPPATQIVDNVATWQPAFDSNNHMVIGFNPWGPGPNPLGGWFPALHGDPLSGLTTPDAYLLDYFSMAYSATFDANDNLYITDMNRSRVLYYDKPTAFLPAILAFSPANGRTGSTVIITGRNLTGTSAVRFNGVSATFTVNSATQITVTVPNSATTGRISLTAPVGGARSQTDFTVCPSTAVAINGGPYCAGATISLTTPTVPGATYAWTGPNGFASAVQNPTIPASTTAASGTYSVTVKVGSCVPSSPGTTNVVVNPTPTMPQITLINIPPVNSIVGAGSPNRKASVAAHPGAVYSWTVGNGTITAGQGTREITFTAGSAGTLTISVTETNTSGCVSAPASKSVTVGPVGSAALYYPITPCRLLDTRNANGPLGGPKLLARPPGQPGVKRTFNVTGCPIPAGAIAVSANLTVTNVAAPGQLILFRSDLTTPPIASAISFRTGYTRANNAFVALPSPGTTFSVVNDSAAAVDFIFDVNGYFR